jgi:hypothetical protein
MTKYEKAASRAIDSYLYANRSQKTFSLYYLACIADKAAFAAGKKKELYPHLDSYRKILPPGAKVFWDGKTGLLSVLNPYHPDKDIEEAVVMPGPFDAAVDMGPGSWTAKLQTGNVL